MFNFIAVIVAAIVAYFVSMIWYSPVLFGEYWMKHSKINPKTMKNPGLTPFIISFGAALASAFVIEGIFTLLETTRIGEGFAITLMLWAGFTAATVLNSVLWERQALQVFFVNIANYLVMFLIMTWILIVW